MSKHLSTRALKEVAISDASIKLPDANMTTAESFPTPWLFHEPQIMEWLKYVAGEEGKTWGSLHIAYYSDEDLLVVNRSYLQHDYYTDIITFDRCRGNRIHGDLAISVERISGPRPRVGCPRGSGSGEGACAWIPAPVWLRGWNVMQRKAIPCASWKKNTWPKQRALE